jgi:RNA polymerase sigma factor (sigma-70 family)
LKGEGKMERFIKIGKEQVKVSEEIYMEYYKMARRERYLENDIKVGSSSIDEETGNVIYKSNKEDSIERMSELGIDFEDENLIEDIVCDKATIAILNEALKELEQEEMELISDLYYKNMTTRQASENKNISQSTVIKRHKKIIEKLKKYF